MKLLKVLLVASLLGGCTQLVPFIDRPVPDETLMQPCPTLEPLMNGNGEAVLRKLVEWAGQYRECAAGKDKLIEAVR